MRSGCIAGTKTRLADIVRHIEEMQSVIGIGCLEKRPHPSSHRNRVRRKIQHDRYPSTEQILNVGTDRLAQSPRAADVVSNVLHFGTEQTAEPKILADNNNGGHSSQLGGEGGFSSRNLSAHHVQNRAIGNLRDAIEFLI